jgi:hypothetical protein
MGMSGKIIEILNKDNRACRLMEGFEVAAKKAGLVGSEYDSAKETVMMIAIAGNQEAMAVMASHVYQYANA